jgi:predicted RNase H-like nuclease
MISLLCAVDIMTILIAVTVLSLIVSVLSLAKISKLSNANSKFITQDKNLLNAPSNDLSKDDKIVAVITAAINAYYQNNNKSSGSKLSFRVRSIKEIR